MDHKQINLYSLYPKRQRKAITKEMRRAKVTLGEQHNISAHPSQDEIARIRKRKRGGNMQLHVSVMFT